jgi:tetratricopeptide (TPR) repeat protein
MFFDGNGEAVDWILGYDPPAENFRAQVDKVLRGVDTFKSLTQAYAKDANSVETAFKLGQKYADHYETAKAAEFFKKVVVLDPDGKKGMTTVEGGQVSYTQNAEFIIAGASLSARPPDPAALLAFVKKYKESPLLRDAYSQLSRSYFSRTAPKDQAAAFYTEYAGRYPNETAPLTAWVQRILLDKEPIDKGIELAEKAKALMKAQAAAAPKPGGASVPAVPMGGGPGLELNLGRLYALKGDKAKAIVIIDQAAKEAGDNTRTISSIAQAYLDISAEDKALAIYGPEFLNKNIGTAAALGPYASFWARQDKNLDSALLAAKKAVELAPDTGSNWLTLANVYVKMKNAAEAIKAADTALAKTPEAQKAMIQRQVDQIKSQAAAIK